MASLLQRGFRRISKEVHYKNRVIENYFKRTIYGSAANKYLFILSPPFCGSTLLNEIISTSSNVSTNNALYTREGQRLPGVMEILYENWDENAGLDWEYIKGKWRLHWDVTKVVLLEKSPPNIVHARELEEHFPPAYFIVNSRNPYAHCEGLMRSSPHNRVPEVAARFAIRCLRYQERNLRVLRNVLPVSYEDLTDDPVKTKERIELFLPELAGIDTAQEFRAHNYLSQKMKITNLNDSQIGRLGHDYVRRINTVFNQHKDLLSAFRYKIIDEYPE